jgi:aminomethyltransferase
VLVGLASSESVPVRAGAIVVDADGNEVGIVTSGTVSPTLGHPIALAKLDAGVAARADAADLRACVRDRRPVLRIAQLPFVPKRYKRG